LLIPARTAVARTTSHSTLGDMPSPQTRPALLMARNTGPCVMFAAAIHASTWLFTHVGMGNVRTCPPLPTRSAITQCSSRLNRFERERKQFGTAQPTADQRGEHRMIASFAWSTGVTSFQQGFGAAQVSTILVDRTLSIQRCSRHPRRCPFGDW
jgi:hypothetical protein